MIKRYLCGLIALVAAVGMVACSSDGGSSSGGTVVPVVPEDTTTHYLYSTASSTPDIASTFDAWSSGTVIDSAFATDATYNPCIKAENTATGSWGTVVAFTNLPAGTVAGYNYITFKVKSASFASLTVKVPETEKAYALSSGTALEGGWIQMKIPVSDFGANPATATQFAIFGAGIGSLYLTDVALYSSTGVVVTTGLSAALTSATTLNSGTKVGTANGEVAQTDKDTFTAAISAASAVLNDSTSTQLEVNTALSALTAATTAFKAAIIVLKPTAFAANPTLLSTDVISLYNSGATYTDIGVKNWNPNWGQQGSLSDYSLTVGSETRTVKFLDIVNYQGLNLCTATGDKSTTAGETLDITGKNSLHISYLTYDASSSLTLMFINNVTDKVGVTKSLTADGTWHDVEFNLGDSTFDFTTMRQLMFTYSGTATIYMDNIYFHEGTIDAPIVPVTPTGLAVTGTGASVYVSGMTGNSLTITYPTAASYGSMTAFVTEGNNSAGRAFANVALTYDDTTHYWTYTGTNGTFTEGAKLYIILLPNGANSNCIPQGDLGDVTTWSSFTYSSSY